MGSEWYASDAGFALFFATATICNRFAQSGH